jgi:photosystem II stability/assembly factor-like uncharacterized protein
VICQAIVVNHGQLLVTSDGGTTWEAIVPLQRDHLLTGVLAFGPKG